MPRFLFGTFYIAMASAALAVEGIFGALRLIPAHTHLMVMEEAIHWNYTSALNVIFIAISGLLFIRFLKTGGPAMLREMGGGARDPNAAPHHCCHDEAPATAKHACHEEPKPATASACCHDEPEPMVRGRGDCCGGE